MTDPTPQQILDTPMTGENDAGALTVRGYLLSLLAMLWIDGEGFSAKRPFGNSGWQWDVYAALGEAGHIAIKFDENGDVEDVNEEAGERLIRAAIGAIDVPTSPAELTEAQRYCGCDCVNCSGCLGCATPEQDEQAEGGR